MKDRYGLSWQIVPEEMIRLITDSDTAKASLTMAALMKMKKLDLDVLRRAAG